MSDIGTLRLPDGVEIYVCLDHQGEVCDYCELDCVEVNNEARARASQAQAAPRLQDGDPLNPSQLRVGTEVRMPNCSGWKPPTPLDGQIFGVMVDFRGETCYVIRLQDKTLINYPVKWAHEEWLVKLDGIYIAASKIANSFKVLVRRPDQTTPDEKNLS
ncbi:hypothetical protein PCANC_03267 [Puccinia coronata f. sp. avenae]|uniref:Uncharacterized protein n=1 Tax=Puccinia coronata f. sp. avenae TaxID=200324 RepID=A0A2N5VZ34_9BASI|nr:hypothetical protein PCANC_03267 [Puccinia coronata f. sp. avenae]